MISKIIFYIGLWASKKSLQAEYGKNIYSSFAKESKKQFKHIIRLTPDIGNSIFKLNFAFTPCYIAWYKAFLTLKMDNDTVICWIWKINENMLLLIPQNLLKRYGAKVYLGGFRKKAEAHEIYSIQKKLHEYDYKIRYKNIDDNTFEIDIYQCGMKRLCEENGALGLLPGICRIDYLLSHYMGCGFSRTKTLGDGNDYCNCRYSMIGNCVWSPENGFDDRK